MNNMNIDLVPLKSTTNHSINDENIKGCIANNIISVSNVETENKLVSLVKRYKIKSIHVIKDYINSVYLKLPEGVVKEEKYLELLTAQKSVLENWKNDIVKNARDPKIKMGNINTQIDEITKKIAAANTTEKKELLTDQTNLLSQKQVLRFAPKDTSIDAKKSNHNLSKIDDELAGIKKDIAVQSRRLAYLKALSII